MSDTFYFGFIIYAPLYARIIGSYKHEFCAEPHCLPILLVLFAAVRMFNHEVLDMFELGVTNFQSVKTIGVCQTVDIVVGCVYCIRCERKKKKYY